MLYSMELQNTISISNFRFYIKSFNPFNKLAASGLHVRKTLGVLDDYFQSHMMIEGDTCKLYTDQLDYIVLFFGLTNI